MAQIQKLIQENQKLKYQLEKFKGSNGLLPYVDDSLFKGGYRVVKTINDRDNIDCCHSKQGMIVCVIGEDLSFKEYRLISDCKNKQWEEVQTQVTENDVILTEDYSDLSENLTTQKELNLVLKQLILNLQTQIDNIELIDEKVQITEDTNFAQIGQTQKDFNKNVSDYKIISDLKNQEQDNRLTDIEGENVAQNDLINELNSELESERTRNDIQDEALNNKLNTPTMTNNYYGLWDDTNKKFINGQLNQDTNGNIGIGATPTDSKVELSPLVNQTALKVLNYSLTESNIQPALDINGTWNTLGTPTLIKANLTDTASNALSLLASFQVGGIQRFGFRKDGVLQFGINMGSPAIGISSTTSLSGTASGEAIYIGRGTIKGTGFGIWLGASSGNRTNTLGDNGHIAITETFNPTSGNARYSILNILTTINQTGGANGITRGLYINPKLTSAADWRSIEWSNNTGYGLYGAGTANNFLAGNLGIGKLLPVEKIDVDGNVKAIDFKGQAVKFNLQTSISPTPNTLVPKTDGSGLVWYDSNSILRNIGENFFSADLSSTTARNHSMNAPFTIDTKGNAYSIKNLPNKNTDIANFRKVRVQDASGLDSVVDSKNLLTDGVTSMTDAEKDAWRLAQRKTNETYSIGQPQPFAVFPPIVENTNEIQDIVVVGSNLFLNNSSPSTALVCLVSETGTEYPLNVEVNQTNPSVLSFGYNFSTLPLGNYWIKVVHNGLINLNKVYLQVTNNITLQPLPNLSWNGYRQAPNTYFTNTNNTTDFVSFTSTAINFTRKYIATSEGNVFINSSAFTLPNDFYLEFHGTCPWRAVNGLGERQPTISMGLSVYNSVFDSSNTYIAGLGLTDEFQNSKLFSDTSVTLNIGDVTNFVFYVIKKGNKIILGIKSKSGVLYSTYTAPAGNQFMIKLAHFNPFPTSQNTLISFAITKILSL